MKIVALTPSSEEPNEDATNKKARNAHIQITRLKGADQRIGGLRAPLGEPVDQVEDFLAQSELGVQHPGLAVHRGLAAGRHGERHVETTTTTQRGKAENNTPSHQNRLRHWCVRIGDRR